MWQEAALAHTAVVSVTTPGKKQRAPPIQVALKNAVLIIRKLIFGAHILCLAVETEKAGPAVPSGWEQGSTKTQKGLREKDTLQWCMIYAARKEEKLGGDEDEKDGDDDGHNDFRYCEREICKNKNALWWKREECMMSENEDDYNDDNDADEDKKDSSSILTADKKKHKLHSNTHTHALTCTHAWTDIFIFQLFLAELQLLK